MRWMIAVLLFLVTLPAQGQAFGTHAGMMVEEFSHASQIGDVIARWSVIPPQENPLMTNYWARIGPTIGLCSIAGHGRFTGDFDSKFASLTGALSDIYGDARFRNGGDAYWQPDGLIILLSKGDEGAFALSYAFRTNEDCEADATSRIFDTTGL